ncbi:MAG TPA: hypothetical protein VF928_06680 [Usitatibacteraceae bacterium]
MKKILSVLAITAIAALSLPVHAGPQWMHHLELTKRFQKQQADVRAQQAAKPNASSAATGAQTAKPVK